MPTYKDEKTGLWYCKFVYKDWTGKSIQKKKMGFKLQREAKEYEMDFLNRFSGSTEMKFKNFVQVYLEDCKVRIKPTTYAGKVNIFETHIIPYFGEMKLNKISATTVRQWQTVMMSNEKKFKKTYLKTVNNQLSALFNYACKYYGLSENPAKICGAMGKKKADKMLFWTLDEFKAFEKAVSDRVVTRTVFNLLYWSGMRSGEMMALTLSDFDFKGKAVDINKNYARLDNEDLILDPKTPKSNRRITLPEHVCDLVQDYVSRLVDYEDGDRLFDVRKGFLYNEMERGCKLSGTKRIRVHDLRHSHASLLIELGFSPLLVSERLGHEDIQTTLETYSHLYPHKNEEVSDKLNKLCG